MPSSETTSRKRGVETIHVAGHPEAKRNKRLRVSLACAEASKCFRICGRRCGGAGRLAIPKSDLDFCSQCRRKKERCDGKQPVCGSCESQDRECSYVQRLKKRGLTTGYVRGLEILLGLIFHSVEGCEHSIVAILKGESTIPSPGSREEHTASTVNVLVDGWRNSPSWKELERILSMVESGEDDEFTARDLHDRLDEALKKSLSMKDREETLPSTVLPEASPADSQVRLIDHGSTSDSIGHPSVQWNDGISTKRTGAIETRSSDTPGPSNLLQDWPELLEVYFANTNSWIPIVLKADAFRAAYILSTESDSSNVSGLPLGDQACLYSMLAYARYTQYITIGNVSFQQDLQGHFANLFARASQLISTYEGRREVGHIQAMLVFTLLHYAQGNLGLAWSLVGRAVYHAVELGLFRSATAQSPLDDRQKRVMLSCFVLETLLSARLHRRPYMRASDVQSGGLLDADGIEEWEPWRPTRLSPSSINSNPPRPSHQPARILSTFNLLVHTSTIMNDNLQGYVNDTGTDIPEKHLDIFRLLQSENRLDNLVAQSEAYEASPQSVNLMLATVACVPYLIPTGTDAEYRNFCPSTVNCDARRILASVLEGIKQKGATVLSPLSDVYLNIIESRNENVASPFSYEALGSIKSVQEIRVRYNGAWSTTDFNPHDSAKATIHAQTEPITVSNARPGVLGEVPNARPSSRDQSSVVEFINTATNRVGRYATSAPSAPVLPQPHG